MNRSVKQWAGCEPALMAQQSEAAIMYALKDAKTDIAELSTALKGIVDSLSAHDDEGMIEHAVQMIAARAALGAERAK